MASLEIPDFGGLQEEAFFTAHEILDRFKTIDRGQKAKVLGLVVRGMSYELFDGEADLADAASAAEALDSALGNVRRFRDIQERRINPLEGHVDLDY